MYTWGLAVVLLVAGIIYLFMEFWDVLFMTAEDIWYQCCECNKDLRKHAKLVRQDRMFRGKLINHYICECGKDNYVDVTGFKPKKPDEKLYEKIKQEKL